MFLVAAPDDSCKTAIMPNVLKLPFFPFALHCTHIIGVAWFEKLDKARELQQLSNRNV